MTKPTPLRVVHGDPDGADLSRPQPHNIDAEQIVLGALMLDGRALVEVRALLDGSEFYRPSHVRIWQAITALADRGDPVHPVPVAAQLGRELTKVGGAPYLHTLIAKVPTTAQAGYYAHLLRELAYARRIIETGTRLVQLGHTAADDGTIITLRATVAAQCATVTAPDVRGWPEPTPLSANPDLPPFPLWALPGWLGDYAAAVAEQTQTPPDLAGCLALAVLAVAAGGRVWVKATIWSEPTNLYTLIVLPPGNRKSEVYAAMTAPIRTAEKQLIERVKPYIAEQRITQRIAEANAERTAKAAETATDPTRRTEALAEANAAAMELDNLTVPAEPKLYSANATGEKLTSLLAAHGGRFAVLAPEGKIFSILAGRYSGTPDLEVFLSGHAGEEMRIDRMGRASELIECATLTLGVCVQPGILARFGDVPEFREQGLLGRLLFSVPESLLGYRKERPAPVPEHIAQTYAANLTALVLSLHDAGDTTLYFDQDPSGNVTERRERTTLHFTPDAENAVVALLADTEPRFRPGGDLAHMTDWGGKLVGATVRIAALLHIANHFRDRDGGFTKPITLDTFTAAIAIGEYYTAHAIAAYDSIGADPAVNGARAILAWMRSTATTRFTARDVMRGLKHRFAKVTDLDPALRVLETHGWIRRLPTPPASSAGRPSAPAYDVHPDALTDPQ